MAINPNTDFTAGAILTASQQNRFPRGIVALTTATSTSATFTTTEVVTITGSSFTAVANRYYEITYYEPAVGTASGTINRLSLGVRLTNLAGAVQVSANSATGPDQNGACVASVVKTLTAGSVNFVGTAVVQSGGGTAFAIRSASSAGYLMVKDLGPA